MHLAHSAGCAINIFQNSCESQHQKRLFTFHILLFQWTCDSKNACHCSPFLYTKKKKKILHVMLPCFCPKNISWYWGVSIKGKAWIDCALRCKWQKLNVSAGRCLWWLHPTTILSCCTVQLQRLAAAIECLQDSDLTRRVAFFFFVSGCRGTWDALAEGSQADCWLLGFDWFCFSPHNGTKFMGWQRNGEGLTILSRGW